MSINRRRVLTPRQCLLAALVPSGASPQCLSVPLSLIQEPHCRSQNLKSVGLYFPLQPTIVFMSLGGNTAATVASDARRHYWNDARPSQGSCVVFTDPTAQLEHGPEEAASTPPSVYLQQLKRRGEEAIVAPLLLVLSDLTLHVSLLFSLLAVQNVASNLKKMTEVTENSDFPPLAVRGGSGNLRPSPPNKRRPTTGNTLSRPSVEETNFPDEGGECDNPKQRASHRLL